MAKDNPIPAGMTKADYMEFKFDDALVEDNDFDLLVMGRTQGKRLLLLCEWSFAGSASAIRKKLSIHYRR